LNHSSSNTSASSQEILPLPLQLGHGPINAAPPQVVHLFVSGFPVSVCNGSLPVPPQVGHTFNPIPLQAVHIGICITSSNLSYYNIFVVLYYVYYNIIVCLRSTFMKTIVLVESLWNL
jgi:hypothetical protein